MSSTAGNAPDHAGGSRAHYSLPQPLHLRAILKDHQGRSVTIRFEQVRMNNLAMSVIDTLDLYYFYAYKTE